MSVFKPIAECVFAVNLSWIDNYFISIVDINEQRLENIFTRT